jgi:hypothetical protein
MDDVWCGRVSRHDLEVHRFRHLSPTCPGSTVLVLATLRPTYIEDAPWMIGVTVVCPLTFAGPDPEPEGAQDRMAEKYGEWASPVMWDFASNIARALAASVLATEFDIPFRTPVPHILSSSDVLKP